MNDYLSHPRRNHRQNNLILPTVPKMQTIPPAKSFPRATPPICIPENPAPLRIPARHFKHDPAPFLHNDIRRPHLHVDGVHRAWDDGLDVRGEVGAVREVCAVFEAGGVDGAVGDAQPAFGEWDGIAGCAGVVHFLAEG